KVEEQARAFGAEIIYDEVTSITRSGEVFVVKTSSNVFYAEAVILAVGKKPRKMKVPGEEELKSRGISYCTICDAPLFKNKVVALTGIGPQAEEGVLILKDVAKRVYWIYPSRNPGVKKETLNLILEKNNVILKPNSKIVRVLGDGRVEGIIVRNLVDGSEETLTVSGVFVELGYIADTGFLKGLVKLNRKGEIVVDKYGRTSHPGIFAAGDVTDIRFKQAVISAG
ncbi:MAG TPA: thioredoxin reductase, partial [Thermoproteales archaeon]|nr:thioredoxin reductase [Thermoproteales archaeon]